MSRAVARTPQDVLDELGAELDAGWRRARQSRWGRHSRWSGGRLVAALMVALVLGISSAAAPTSLFAPAPPLPRLAARAVILAGGTVAGQPWELLVSSCDRHPATVSLLLRSATAGAGSACGPVVAAPTTIYDSHSSHAFVFGAAPAGTVEVDLALGGRQQRVPATPANPGALTSAGVPAGTVFYVTSIPLDQQVTATTGFDAHGALVLACRVERCTAP